MDFYQSLYFDSFGSQQSGMLTIVIYIEEEYIYIYIYIYILFWSFFGLWRFFSCVTLILFVLGPTNNWTD